MINICSEQAPELQLYSMRSSILPTTSLDLIQTVVPRRYVKTGIYLLCAFAVLTNISFLSGSPPGWSPFAQKPPNNADAVTLAESPNYPPDYVKWHEFEEALPQHNENLAFPEGKEGRYVYFSEHVKSTFLFLSPNSWRLFASNFASILR